MSKPPYLRLRDGFSNMAPKPKAAIKYLNWISWKLIMLIFQMLLSRKSRGDYGDGSGESREGPTVRRWGPAQHPQKSKAQWCVSVVSALGIHEGDEPWDSLLRQLSKWVWAPSSARDSLKNSGREATEEEACCWRLSSTCPHMEESIQLYTHHTLARACTHSEYK